jgi:methyl-accepting chemotaxis protein
MTLSPPHPFDRTEAITTPLATLDVQALDAVTDAAAKVGRSSVEIGGFLADLGQNAVQEQTLLTTIEHGLGRVLDETRQMESASQTVVATAADAKSVVAGSITLMQTAGEQTRRITDWVAGVQGWITDFMGSLAATEKNLAQITHIAREVNILALNARIEAARAGSAGAGFAVIAEAIGALARDTASATEGISKSLTQVRNDAVAFSTGAEAVAQEAILVMAGAKDVDRAFSDIQRGMAALDGVAGAIGSATIRVRDAVGAYAPDIRTLAVTVRDRGEDITRLANLSTDLIDTSETMVQRVIGLGGSSTEQAFIDRVRDDAAQLSRLLEDALSKGDITEAALFSTDYQPVPNSDPTQVVAPFTNLTDRLFPPVQEAALGLSSRVVFCAAVDRNGYLPTHNQKFSQPQGKDPVWNAANCRNRRIFNDRVGLKAGRGEAPFLLQVYRRDMGGGQFKIMMDVSAPITVRGRHWGGLRLAFS